MGARTVFFFCLQFINENISGVKVVNEGVAADVDGSDEQDVMFSVEKHQRQSHNGCA